MHVGIAIYVNQSFLSHFLSWQKVSKNRGNFQGNFPQRLRPKGKPRTSSTQTAFANASCLLPLLLGSFQGKAIW